MPRVIEQPEYGSFDHIPAGRLCQGIVKMCQAGNVVEWYGHEFWISSPDNWTSALRYYLTMEHVLSVTNFCALNIMRVGELLL